MDYLVECMTDGRDIGYLQYYQKVMKEKTGRGSRGNTVWRGTAQRCDSGKLLTAPGK